MSRTIVPVTELGPEHGIEWYFSLPSPVQDQVGIDVKAARRLMRLGGISEISVVSYGGDRTTYDYGTSGLSSDGTASITKVGSISKAELQESEAIDPDSNLVDIILGKDPTYHELPAIVHINSTEFNDKVNHRLTSSNDNYPKAVASILNMAISQGIAESGTVHNLQSNMFKLTYELAPITVALVRQIKAVALESKGFNGDTFLGDYAQTYLALLIGSIANTELIRKRIRKECPADRRPQLGVSLGFHFDRLTILNVLARSTKIVRPLS